MTDSAESFRCRLCRGSQAAALWQGLPDRLQRIPGSFRYVRCDGCGLVQLDHTPANLGEYYQRYGRHAAESPIYAMFRRLITGGCYVFPGADGGSKRLLDFGCGNGWYLKAMQKRGWQPWGYEFDGDFARSLTARLDVPVVSSFEELDELKGSVDLITLNFVFEHLDNPQETMRQLLRLLRPGGEIVVAVPNLAGREARVFGPRWFHLDPPRHIVHFTKSQLTALLSQLGYVNVHVEDLPVATGFAGSISYRIFGYLHPAVWYPGVLPGFIWSWFVPDGNFRARAQKPRPPAPD